MSIKKFCGCTSKKPQPSPEAPSEEQIQSLKDTVSLLERKVRLLDKDLVALEDKLLQKLGDKIGELSNDLNANDKKMKDILRGESLIEKRIAELNSKIECLNTNDQNGQEYKLYS